MPRATLATVQTSAQLKSLEALVLKERPECSIKKHYNMHTVVSPAGYTLLSAATRNGADWSVQLDESIAYRNNIPLWKDS